MENLNKLKILLESNPLWYQNENIIYYLNLFNKNKLTKKERSDKNDFKVLLKNTNFITGGSGYNWDKWRLPIDCVVLHHTSSSPTISLSELNVLGLRLYIQQYLKDNDVKNQPLYSGHYWYGKDKTKENMTFVSYHYLIRPSGKIIQLVEDTAYLWHAGNLEINRKSISIALSGKFIDKGPSIEALQSVSKIIKEHNISADQIFGHNEVINKKILGETSCPGNTFLTSWKKRLYDIL